MDNPEKWNSEEKRLERKERLNSLKARDGGKKPIKKTNKFLRIFIPVVAAVLVIAIGVWAVIQFAIPQKIFPPMTVGGEKISSVDFSYYYANSLQQLQIDKSTDEGKTKLAEKCTEAGYTDKTWKEYAFDLAAKAIVEMNIQNDLAVAAKMELSNDEKVAVDNIFDNLIKETGDAVKADKYLIEAFGKNVTIATLKPVFLKQQLAAKFAEKKATELAVTDQEIKAEYDANKDKYESVTFRIAFFETETKDGATTSETTKFDANAKTAAETFLSKAADESTFKTLAAAKTIADEKLKYSKMTAAEKKTADADKVKTDKAEATKISAMTPEEKIAYETGKANQDTSILRGLKRENIESVSPDMAAWLYDAARKSGNKKAFSVTGGYYSVYFVSRDTSFNLPSVRHILISPNKDKNVSNGDVFTVAEWTAARKKAQDLLKQCTSLEKFISLVKANSTDTGSVDNGGLYENVQFGQMMPEFNDWAFDPARKADDQAIVRTDYGFHIMRYIGKTTSTSLSQNKATIKTALSQKKYTDFLAAKKALAEYKYTLSDLGISLLGF
ncbi:MAG: peptidylprolyl isomerase [Saccharofermentanales bacterium]